MHQKREDESNWNVLNHEANLWGTWVLSFLQTPKQLKMFTGLDLQSQSEVHSGTGSRQILFDNYNTWRVDGT